MRMLVAIDDTDNLESIGTGELASILSETMNDRGWGKGGFVTRHQMLVHPDIPYTSHNSAMCFPAEIYQEHLATFVAYAIDFLREKSAEGSDPGLCVANIEHLSSPGELIGFGRNAKQKVLTKEDAYALANRLDIHLSEHGGTGLGVIGALAAVGLRMTGNDGRFRGHFKLDSNDGMVTAQEIMAQTHVDVVTGLDGRTIAPTEKIRLGQKVKAVLLGGKSTLLVSRIETNGNGGVLWETCSKKQLRKY